MIRLSERSKKIIVAPAVFLVFFLYLSRFGNALTDDAFITLQYSKNLLRYGQWGLLPHNTSNSATSPLNVVWTASVGSITADWPRAAVCCAAVCFTLILIFGIEISRKLTGKGRYGFVLIALLALNPLLMSTIGLESVLFVTFLTASAYCMLHNRSTALSVLLALLTLTRPEGALLFLLVLLQTPRKMRFAIIYSCVLLPWYVFSWVHLGALLPDTLWIKTLQKWGPDAHFWNGPLLYLQMYPLETMLSFFAVLLIVPVILMLLRKPSEEQSEAVLLLASYGVFHFIAYSLLRVPPYHWYYAPSICSIALAGWMAVLIVQKSNRTVYRTSANILLLLCSVVPVIGMLWIFSANGFRFVEPPIHSNWATQQQFHEMAEWIREHVPADNSVQLRGEIGTLAFYSDRLLLDYFSDRRILFDYLDRTKAERSAFGNAVLKLNFLFHKLDTVLPPPKFELIAVANRDRYPDQDSIQVWLTSTRWIPNGKWILRAIPSSQ